MKTSAIVRNDGSHHNVVVAVDGRCQSLDVPERSSGQGSGISGGEFLMLALATCYCNDLYREAAKLGLTLRSVEVEASAEFAGVGLAASNVSYRATATSPASAQDVEELLRLTDVVSEVQNTLRAGVPVTLRHL